MKDTRLLNLQQSLEGDLEIIEELRDSKPNDRELERLKFATQLIASAIKALGEAFEQEVCGVKGGFSAVCELPEGHDGKHRHRTFEWDEPVSKQFIEQLGKLD